MKFEDVWWRLVTSCVTWTQRRNTSDVINLTDVFMTCCKLSEDCCWFCTSLRKDNLPKRLLLRDCIRGGRNGCLRVPKPGSKHSNSQPKDRRSGPRTCNSYRHQSNAHFRAVAWLAWNAMDVISYTTWEVDLIHMRGVCHARWQCIWTLCAEA